MKNKCDICGKIFEGYGNNPAPLEGKVCCDNCNKTYVIPARLKQLKVENKLNDDDQKLRRYTGDLIKEEVKAVEQYDDTMEENELTEEQETTLEEIRNDEIDHTSKLSGIYNDLMEGAVEEDIKDASNLEESFDGHYDPATVNEPLTDDDKEFIEDDLWESLGNVANKVSEYSHVAEDDDEELCENCDSDYCEEDYEDEPMSSVKDAKKEFAIHFKGLNGYDDEIAVVEANTKEEAIQKARRDYAWDKNHEIDTGPYSVTEVSDSRVVDLYDMWLIETDRGILKFDGKTKKFTTREEAEDYIENNSIKGAVVRKAEITDNDTVYGDGEDVEEQIEELNENTVEMRDSSKLEALAYKFGQMANYFDRANSIHSSKILAREDSKKIDEFLGIAREVLKQLNTEISQMERAGNEYDDLDVLKYVNGTNIRNLITDASDRLSWLDRLEAISESQEREAQKLSKQIDNALNEYMRYGTRSKKKYKDSAVVRDSDTVNDIGMYAVGSKYRWEDKYGNAPLTLQEVCEDDTIKLTLDGDGLFVKIPREKFEGMIRDGTLISVDTVRIDGYSNVIAAQDKKFSVKVGDRAFVVYAKDSKEARDKVSSKLGRR